MARKNIAVLALAMLAPVAAAGTTADLSGLTKPSLEQPSDIEVSLASGRGQRLQAAAASIQR